MSDVYRIRSPKTGREYKLRLDAPPTQAEIDSVFAQFESGKPRATPKPQPTKMDMAAEFAKYKIGGGVPVPPRKVDEFHPRRRTSPQEALDNTNRFAYAQATKDPLADLLYHMTTANPPGKTTPEENAYYARQTEELNRFAMESLMHALTPAHSIAGSFGYNPPGNSFMDRLLQGTDLATVMLATGGAGALPEALGWGAAAGLGITPGQIAERLGAPAWAGVGADVLGGLGVGKLGRRLISGPRAEAEAALDRLSGQSVFGASSDIASRATPFYTAEDVARLGNGGIAKGGAKRTTKKVVPEPAPKAITPSAVEIEAAGGDIAKAQALAARRAQFFATAREAGEARHGFPSHLSNFRAWETELGLPEGSVNSFYDLTEGQKEHLIAKNVANAPTMESIKAAEDATMQSWLAETNRLRAEHGMEPLALDADAGKLNAKSIIIKSKADSDAFANNKALMETFDHEKATMLPDGSVEIPRREGISPAAAPAIADSAEASVPLSKNAERVNESRARLDEIKKRLRDKGYRVNMGVDPTVMADWVEAAYHYMRMGYYSFKDWAPKFLADFPDAKPYLKHIYAKAQGMGATGTQKFVEWWKKGPSRPMQISDLDFTPKEILDDIKNSRYGDLNQKRSAMPAAQKLMAGETLQEHQVRNLNAVLGTQFTARGWRKAMNTAGEVWNLPRELMASWDLSAPLRQGIFLSMAHPKQAIKASWDMFRSLKTSNYNDLMADVLSRPNVQRAMNLGETSNGAWHSLDITDAFSGTVHKSEEAFVSSLGGRIPGVKQSGNAYAAFLNKLRADVLDQMIAAAGGKVSDAELSALSHYINVATGRGHDFGKAADMLNKTFFAPRFAASRAQLAMLDPIISPMFRAGRAAEMGVMGDMSAARIQKMIIADYAKFVAGAGTLLTLGSIYGPKYGVTVGWRPESKDFGQFKVGNTYVDLFSGGTRTWVNFVTRLGRLSAGLEADPSRKDNMGPKGIIHEFLDNKLNPSAQMAMNLLFGYTGGLYGKRLDRTSPDFWKALAVGMLPMAGPAMQDIFWHGAMPDGDMNWAVKGGLSGLNLFGASTRVDEGDFDDKWESAIIKPPKGGPKGPGDAKAGGPKKPGG